MDIARRLVGSSAEVVEEDEEVARSWGTDLLDKVTGSFEAVVVAEVVVVEDDKRLDSLWFHLFLTDSRGRPGK